MDNYGMKSTMSDNTLEKYQRPIEIERKYQVRCTSRYLLFNTQK